jgi:prepilin-type N-terminal cleavage/methylation domain-containing protein
MKTPRPRGFTLVELVLVLAILTALLALLFPVLGAARKTARMTTCLSHLRQLGLAVSLYQGEYDGYPTPHRWINSVADRRLLVCPDDTTFVPRGTATSYTFRYRIPPDFQPFWQALDVHPNLVLALCRHHSERNELSLGELDVPRYPYRLVLRANGAVQRVAMSQIREVPIPSGRVEFTHLYPGEPGYAEAAQP